MRKALLPWRRSSLFFLVLCCLLLPLYRPAVVSAQAGKAVTAPTTESVTEFLQEKVLTTGTPGISAAVSLNGRVVYSGGAGYADLEHLSPATGTTVHNIGSVSKVNAVLAIMALLEEGKLSLDDPIQKYVESFPDKGHPITLRNILTHTSGIRHYGPHDFENGFENMRRYRSIRDAIAIFKDDPLLFEPGTYWSYSSYAANLLGGVVEKASGMGFEEYLRERIWGPAGMLRTSFDIPERIVRNRASSYLRVSERMAEEYGFRPNQLIEVPYGDLSYKWAGGGMISSAEDLVRMVSALNSGQLLQEQTLDLMYQPQFEGVQSFRNGDPRPLSFRQALIWRLEENSHGHRMIDHGGSVLGSKTFLVNFPDSDLAVAVIGNLRSFDPRPVALEIAERYLHGQ